MRAFLLCAKRLCFGGGPTANVEARQHYTQFTCLGMRMHGIGVRLVLRMFAM